MWLWVKWLYGKTRGNKWALKLSDPQGRHLTNMSPLWLGYIDIGVGVVNC